MITTRIPLIEVLTIKPRMLKQIRVLSSYGSQEQISKIQQIRELLKNKDVRPLGWISGTFVDGAPDSQELWLIHLRTADELWFIFAPDRHSQLWAQHQPVPQLFI